MSFMLGSSRIVIQSEGIFNIKQHGEVMAITEKQTLTVLETAKILGIGRQSAYELARKGELPGVRRLGGRFIVSRSELDLYLGKSPE